MPRTRTRQPDIVEVQPLLLQESDDEAGGPFNADGTVNVVIIRPGQAQGRGKRIYPAKMLQESAGVFKGWPMFDNHESPAARKARANLPRPTSDLRGEIRESHWDPEFTTAQDAEMGHDRGAVVGKAMPTPMMRELIESVPSALKLSMRAFATGVQRGTYRGKPAELVEGIEEAEGSVDFVTRAGAGGHVLALMESGYDREHGDAERVLEAVEDDDLVHHLREHRPYLLEAAPADPPNGEVEVADEPTGITLEEALKAPEFATAMSGMIATEVRTQVAAERELMEAEVRKDSNRQVEIRDLRDVARSLIEESKLPPSFQEDLRLRYRLEEAADGSLSPSASLNVVAETDAEGMIVKPARKVLEEALTADITRERAKLAEARPTTVRGQGASTIGDGTSAPASGAGSGRRGGGFAAGLRSAGVQTDRVSDANRREEGKVA